MVSQVHLNDSTTVKQQISFAMRLCQQKEYSQAQSYLKAILTQQQKNAGAWYLLGFIAAQKKQYDSAVETVREAIKINPEDAALHHNLGNLYLNQKLLTKAIKSYLNAVSLKPEAYQPYHGLGVAYAMQGDLVSANFSYGLTEDKQGNLRKAIAYYQKVVEIRQNHALAHYKLGESNYKLGELDLAISYYQKALELHPHHPSILSRLAKISQEQHQLDKAIYYYKQVIKQFPQHSESHWQLSFLYHQQNKPSLAFAAYENATKCQTLTMDYFSPFDSDPFEVERSFEGEHSTNKIPLLKAAVELSKNQATEPKISNKAFNLAADTNKATSLNQKVETKDLPVDFQKILETEYHRNRGHSLSTATKDLDLNNKISYDQAVTEKIIIPIVVDLKSNDSESDIVKLEKTPLETQDRNFDTHARLFFPLDKELVAQRIFDNDRTFLLTTFITPEQEYLLPKILKHLKPTRLSFSFFRAPVNPKNEPSTLEKTDLADLANTKPNCFASIYQDLQEQEVYQRKYRFSHLIYIEARHLFSLDWQKIEILQNYCDRQFDFAVANWLYNLPQSLKADLDFEEKFLIASGKIQLYRLGKQSLWMWEVWQQAIVEYRRKAQQQTVPVNPGDESFLDYAWNSILCHIPDLNYAWLTPDEATTSWLPIARTLVS